MLERQFGITGMPGGGTHFAAKLFGIGHENGSGERGLADYLLHVPAHLWPDQGNFATLLRGGDGTQGPLSERWSFTTKLVVLRHPCDVVATNMGMPHRGTKFMRRLEMMSGEALNPYDDLERAMLTTLRWYRNGLDWADGAHFRCERPETAIPYLDFPLTIPNRKSWHSLASEGQRMTRYTVTHSLPLRTRGTLQAFLKEFGYED